MNEQIRIGIVNDHDVARAALHATRIAERAGLDATRRSMFATAVSELARNVVKYAGRGEALLRGLESPRAGVEVVVSDRGPGIPDATLALSDHFSTSGTLGLGLPGVKRLMDEFVLESTPGEGTRVTARKWR